MTFQNVVMNYVDPPLIPTRWWLPLRLLQRSIPLLATLLPTAAYVDSTLFLGLVVLLMVSMMVLAGWSVASADATGWRRTVMRTGNVYVGFAFSGMVLIGCTAPLTRAEPLSAKRTLVVAFLLYVLMLLGEKMMTRRAGKPVRPTPRMSTRVEPAPTPERSSRGAPRLIDIATVIAVVLATWRPRRW
ncbi:hypothetical protein [Tsukamurella pseudospumae]|uniref:hypothetical protein n=1 Tax=Tsukamurella pseudospumae TaxID=239498 RepID=UPI0011124F3F|nr:hypothetical protein [Tsukamurella pseudospumae]